ncbi:insecticidal toxin protein [Morganella morganii]|uniref:Tc toxin subunit A-related protein n=1 Tax=Morganella morganii TaxID=582 RepID=UPI0009C13DE9|nr:neuraminidase-like domain-containing protein [Morganella morganii]OQP25785.1 insecticidal toxin protein [Morganella morganii]OQP28605.1 insecticidal toxin protein [Morganella morganii]HCT5880043.1 insecticidal toxin protein [Morganella morganii]
MDKITRILEKLNQQRSGETVTLADFMPMSLAEVRSLAGGRLSREEAQLLHRAAIKEQQNNILYTARALTRANPLLKKEMGAARTYGATPYGYNDIIMPRADEFAAPGAVSSMFSPAGYLTELYREARGLHQKDSVNNLDKRRPDLAKLVLSQENLDKEISTLSLANEQQETALMAQAGQTDKNKYYETLATSRRSGVTPYNAPFEGIRNALAQQDFVLPDHVLSKGAESAAQMALYAGISPELYAILTEKTDGLSESATEALLKKNFPGVNTDSLMKPDALANYYELPRDEVQALPWISIPYGSSLKETHNLYEQNKTQIIKAGDTDGDVFYTLTHTRLKNEYEHWLRFEYIDLIPLGNNQFCINFSISYLDRAPSGLHIGVVTPNSNYPTDIYSSFTATPEKGKHYSIQGTIPAAKVTPEITISVYTNIHNAWYGHSTFAVTKTTTVPLPLLLTLNKTLRLAKATGMTPLETQRALTRLKLKDTDSDATVLHRFCEFLLYRKRYNISSDDALILSGATISTVSYDGQLSQFDRMFNNPPLNGEVYSLGGGKVNTARNSEDKRLPYLLRALETDRSEINDIRWLVNASNTEIENTLRRISEMYLVKLLADLCGITVSRLSFLHGMYDHKMLIKNLDDPERRGIINFLWQTTGWLSKQDISADTLSLLTYLSAPNQPTDEMNTLLDALRNAGIDNKNTDTLRATMAPVIAGTMQLENPEQGEAVLHWLDNNHPDKVPLTRDFWVMLINNKTPDLQAKWCQALAQRVLVIRTLSLSGAELRILSTGAPVSTVKELREISEFHRLANRCGNNVGNVLEKLNKRALSVSDLESCANIPYTIILGALGIDLNTYITTWKQLAKLPACIDMADTLHILPEEFTSLFTITEKTTPTYSELTTVAGKLQAGLNEQQTKQLQDQSEPRLSEALSGEYRSLVMGKPLANRDDIWRTLLIDGKVSAEITTTPLADAIAGIQLYINRTVAGDEPGADSAVLERQFFKDWDTYNKRYSTWAGVSQLVYYPENYIDPTIRIGQTEMMNTMLEQLSQSELNNDTLEDGFRQYLTAFEQVANLKVVSGYHDAVDIDEGNTWFIGTSQTEPKKYYWRKTDHSKCQNGHFAANAWSDWKEITCAINPYQDMVRPVIFRSRLYLLWVEKQVRKDDDGKKEISSFTLKLTHIKYDGSWASPFSYDVTKSFENTLSGDHGIGLLCTENSEDETLTVACYTKQEKYNFTNETIGNVPPTKNNTYFGLQVTTDMTVSPANNINELLHVATNQLDRPGVLNVISRIAGKYVSTIIPQEQTDNKQVTIELTEKYNKLISGGNEKYVELAADITLSFIPAEIPAPLRSHFYYQFNLGKTYTDRAKKISYESKDPLFPEGVCTLHKTDTIYSNGSRYTLYLLSVPAGGDISSVRNNLNLFKQTESNGSDYLGVLSWVSSDENYHYFFMVTETLSDLYAPIKYTIRNNINKKIYALITTGGWETYLNSGKYINDLNMSFLHDTTMVETLNEPTVNIETSATTNAIVITYLVPITGIKVTKYVEKSKLDLTLRINYKNRICSGVRNYSLHYEEPIADTRTISLHTTEDGAQYMEWGAYRTRLNTLFARQLIERANRGIEAILSPETQNLRESKLGKGSYVTLTLKPYDSEIHGSDRKFMIYCYSYMTIGITAIYRGELSVDANTEITLFIPVADKNTEFNDRIILSPLYQKPLPEKIRDIFLHRVGENNENPHGWTLDKSYNNGTFPGLESVSGLSQPDEPMDFSGANALYFWELFYYTPMMVAMRLLQEQNFTEANRWLSYIWRPAASGAGDWRVRPLKEDTSWNADPLDSVDPDAVAQNDPMHYKVSTLMKLLDLLIARGDSAYRMLERDTLNEAKMWYMQALGLLGDKPLTAISSAWSNPALSNAADKTQAKQFHDEISRIRSGGLLPEVRTANTLTGLFLPQQNEKLLGYWQTLEMRLFNLRNNLSIDGQPLSLPIFAAPADPAALLSAAAAASGGSKALPSAAIPAMRFPQALDSARSLTGQLMQFGSSLQGLIERRDAEAMSELLQNQAGELMLSSLRMQEQALTELDAEKKTLEQSRAGAQSRFDSYRALYDENVSAEEKRTMDLYLSSAILSTSIEGLNMAAAAADMAPNVFGMAVGGSRWGGIPKAIGSGIALTASATKINADNISQSEAWRRRRQEWEIQKNNAESEVKQIDAQLEALAVRRTATEMQREHLEIQQAQTQAQLEFLQRKFSNKALYSWLHGRLASIYYRFYDLTATRCMMAEAAFAWQTGETTRYIKPGAWQSSNAGLMAGESLLLNLTEMEQAWLKWNHRTLKVTRTVSLAKVYKEYDTPVNLAEKIAELLKGSGSGNTPAATGLSMTADKELYAAFNLKALKIAENYPARLGKTRRIKQISVTLPALTGPYQDVRAVLSYGGDVRLPDGCKAIAVSHGMNDDGQFRLDFNDGHWLPFEGIPVDNDSSLFLSFPEATKDEQKALLLSLSDIIIHIRYTIR